MVGDMIWESLFWVVWTLAGLVGAAYRIYKEAPESKGIKKYALIVLGGPAVWMVLVLSKIEKFLRYVK